MPQTIERLYFTRRAEQSRIAMRAAAGRGARLAHRQLRKAYAILAEPAPASRSEGREELACWANEGGFTP